MSSPTKENLFFIFLFHLFTAFNRYPTNRLLWKHLPSDKHWLPPVAAALQSLGLDSCPFAARCGFAALQRTFSYLSPTRLWCLCSLLSHMQRAAGAARLLYVVALFPTDSKKKEKQICWIQWKNHKTSCWCFFGLVFFPLCPSRPSEVTRSTVMGQ